MATLLWQHFCVATNFLISLFLFFPLYDFNLTLLAPERASQGASLEKGGSVAPTDPPGYAPVMVEAMVLVEAVVIIVVMVDVILEAMVEVIMEMMVVVMMEVTDVLDAMVEVMVDVIVEVMVEVMVHVMVHVMVVTVNLAARMKTIVGG